MKEKRSQIIVILLVVAIVAFFFLDLDKTHVQEKPDSSQIDTSEYYDYLLCSGGGYSIVAKQVETVTEVTEYIGVLDENYNWVIELEIAENNPFGWSKYFDFEKRCRDWASSVHYAGEGVFIQNEYVAHGPDDFSKLTSWNILENTSDKSDRVRTNTLKLKNGYIIMADVGDIITDKVYIAMMDKHGQFIKTNIICKSYRYVGQYAEGVFFSYDGFYDINGNLVIDLSEYAGLIKNNPCFSNGECTLIAENENGTEFVAVIDLNGNFVSEFAKR